MIWAIGYNIIALPLAAGIVISLALGAVFMLVSMIMVAINARLLKLD